MKEDNSQSKKVSEVEVTQSTKNTFLSRRMTIIQPATTFSLTARKKSVFYQDIQNPQILNQSRYEKVYQMILKDTTKVHKYFSNEQDTIERDLVKNSISRILKIKDQQNDFNDRFLIKPKLKCKTARGSRNTNIGFTNLEKQEQNRRYFFSNHKKGIQLEKQSMLLEYFLKDEGENKPKTQTTYLINLQETSRHRRLTPNSTATNKLYNSHNEKQYRSLKKRVHLKEQFVQKCCEIAKQNIAYRRKQNFKQIQYILSQNNKNMMNEDILHESTPQQREQLQKNNKLIRIFLKYQFFISHNRVQEYFTETCVTKFKKDFFSLNPNFYLKEKEIDEKIMNIIELKQNKVLHFQDFKELIYYLSDVTNTNVLELFLQKFPKYCDHRADSILKDNEIQIERYMTAHKIKFLLNIIFNTYPQKLIGKKIIPIKLIPSFFKAYGISQKDFDIHQLFYSYHWMQHYDAGLTFDEFYKGSILFGMKGSNWKGIETLLRKIDVKKYI